MEKVQAYFNHGRWVADCPREDCNGAELVFPGLPFACLSCRTGKPYEVIFPQDAEKIVEILRLRPTENMNWEPGETLDFLRAENKAHGLET